MSETLIVGAPGHNLKNVSIELPASGWSSSPACRGRGSRRWPSTRSRRGQRRYVESLSSYARQFPGQMDKPDVDFIEGLSPASRSTRSRRPQPPVHGRDDHRDLRLTALLFARIGVPHCPQCGRQITRQTPQQNRRPGAGAARGHRFQVCCRWSGAARGSTSRCWPTSASRATTRARVDGEVVRADGYRSGPAPAGPLREHTPSRWLSTGWCAGRGSSAA